MLFEWGGKGAEDPDAYAARGVLPFLATSPPNILAASSFLQRYLSLLSAPSSPQKDTFIGSAEGVQLTTSPTLNFLQLAVLTVQRAPAPGTSAVQARGMDGGVARDWQQLVSRYRRMAGNSGVLAQKEVVEVRLRESRQLTAGARGHLHGRVPHPAPAWGQRHAPEPYGQPVRRRRRRHGRDRGALDLRPG